MSLAENNPCKFSNHFTCILGGVARAYKTQLAISSGRSAYKKLNTAPTSKTIIMLKEIIMSNKYKHRHTK